MIAEKAMFRDPSSSGAASFLRADFEWTSEKGYKHPLLFSAADGSPILAFAGLWDCWIDPATKEELLSCTTIVWGAAPWMTLYHDPTPVLLRVEDFAA